MDVEPQSDIRLRAAAYASVRIFRKLHRTRLSCDEQLVLQAG